jgi:AcrR family transcriptional regulator
VLSNGRRAPAFRRDPAEKKLRLIASARQLFSEQGFDSTSTLQIAVHAGVSEGILFHHFGSKKGLFTQLAEEFAQAAAIATMPTESETITEESVVRAAFDFADADPALYEMFQLGGADISTREIAAHSEIIVDIIAKQLSDGISRGDIRPGNPKIMAQLQFAVVDGAYRAWRQTQKAELREAYIEEAIACMQAMLSDEEISDD